jgi:hypothetical protein
MTENSQNPPTIPVKKGLPAIAWVGIGCGSFVIIALIVVSLGAAWFKRNVDVEGFQRNPAKAAAELAVKLNPDIELVSQDEAKGEMTIRTKDGKEMTLSYKDVADGKINMRKRDSEPAPSGYKPVSEMPSWVPRPPNSKETDGSNHSSDANNVTGLFVANSKESVEALGNYFIAEALKLDLSKSADTNFNSAGLENRTITFEGEGRRLNVTMLGTETGEVQVSVFYSAKK